MKRYIKEFANDMIGYYRSIAEITKTVYEKAKVYQCVESTSYVVGAYERNEITSVDAVREILAIYDRWKYEEGGEKS